MTTVDHGPCFDYQISPFLSLSLSIFVRRENIQPPFAETKKDNGN